MKAVSRRLERAWASDAVRLVGLTLYYVAIIAGLALTHGGTTYRPPPYVYQAF